MLKEQIEEIILAAYTQGAHTGHTKQWAKSDTEAVLNLFKAEVDKLTVIEWEEINAIDMKNAESNFTDALIDTARAQLQHTKKQLFSLMGE